MFERSDDSCLFFLSLEIVIFLVWFINRIFFVEIYEIYDLKNKNFVSF